MDETARQKVMELLKRTIRPEFLNRVDEIIMFTPLGKEEIREVVRLQVKRIVKMLEEQGLTLEFSEAAIDWLAAAGFDPHYGARPIKRAIQRYVLNRLSQLILAEEVQKERPVSIDAGAEGLTFRN